MKKVKLITVEPTDIENLKSVLKQFDNMKWL